MSHKKAMSPLFSTIILIGFAIALGGVVMSWGKGGYTAEKEVAGCEQTSLSLVSYGENKGICSKENRLYFTVLNNGKIELDGIKVSLIGSEEIYSSAVENRINVADVVRFDFGYPDIGKVEKVIFTPRFTSEGARLCPKEGFSIEDIGEC